MLDSRGSLIPLFRKLIREGATKLPITDPRMTRFWITLDQGVEFVLRSLARMQGGEIFVPKIPSMRVVDVARAMAPGLEHEIVGVRPSEKLHEVLISEDDARLTLELDDAYIVRPAFHFWTPEAIHETGARPVAEDFRYTSDTNTQWIDAEGLQRLLNEHESGD